MANIGNYKGVMLCNRPFNGTKVSPLNTTNASSGPRPFVTGGSSSTLGQNVPIFTEQPYSVKRDKTGSVLSKHKKFLHDLQKERYKWTTILEQDEKRKKETRLKFSQREAITRAAITAQERNEDNEEDIVKQVKKQHISLPMWARSQQSAEEEEERQEEEDADALLNFAAHLDIDEYMANVEESVMANQVQDTIKALEVQMEEEQRVLSQAEAQVERVQSRLVALNASNLSALDDEFRNKKSGVQFDDDDVHSVASTCLSDCKSLKSVHSSRSIAVLTARAQQKLLETVVEETHDRILLPLSCPKIITHDEEDGVRISNKNNPSLLPYIRRNPGL